MSCVNGVGDDVEVVEELLEELVARLMYCLKMMNCWEVVNE